MDELATKEDLAKVEGALREEFALVKAKVEGMARYLEKAVASKEDLANIRTEFKGDLANLRMEFRLLWLGTIFVIVFLNQNALEFIARLFGLMK